MKLAFNRLSFHIVFFISLLSTVKLYSQIQNPWTMLGKNSMVIPNSNIGPFSNSYTIAADKSFVYASYINGDYKNALFKLIDNNWTFLDSASNSMYTSFVKKTQMNDNKLYIAYLNNNNFLKVQYLLNDVEWKAVGEVNSQSLKNFEFIFIESTPFLAYINQDSVLTVTRFNGSNWENVGSLSNFKGIFGSFKISSKNNTPYLLFEHINSHSINLLKFNGLEWQNVTTLPSYIDSRWKSISTDTLPTCALYLDGSTPYISYSDFKAQAQVFMYLYYNYVKKFNGINWDYVGEPSTENFIPYSINRYPLYTYNTSPQEIVAIDSTVFMAIRCIRGAGPINSSNYPHNCSEIHSYFKYNGENDLSWLYTGNSHFFRNEFSTHNGKVFRVGYNIGTNKETNESFIGTTALIFDTTNPYDKTTSINSKEQSNTLIYPTNTEGVINITTDEEIHNILIFNYLGQLLKQSKSKQLNISDLSSGGYLVQVKTDKGYKVQKIFKL